jgi:hypothetical protein
MTTLIIKGDIIIEFSIIEFVCFYNNSTLEENNMFDGFSAYMLDQALSPTDWDSFDSILLHINNHIIQTLIELNPSLQSAADSLV